MAVRIRFEPIDRDIRALVANDLAPAAQSKALADFAREQLADADVQNAQAFGFPPPHDTFVDGREGAALDSVKPDGTIHFEFHLLTDLFEWIDAQLILNSPVRTGRFAKSFVFFADGVEADPKKPPIATNYSFTNTTPYARKIERGLSKQAPDGVFEAVATLASRRFGNIARIRFTYVSLSGKSKDVGSRQPAILVTL